MLRPEPLMSREEGVRVVGVEAMPVEVPPGASGARDACLA